MWTLSNRLAALPDLMLTRCWCHPKEDAAHCLVESALGVVQAVGTPSWSSCHGEMSQRAVGSLVLLWDSRWADALCQPGDEGGHSLVQGDWICGTCV